jgi:tyrosinase
MVRIFMAPKYDERKKPFDFNTQRRLMIELDKFKADCEWIVVGFVNSPFSFFLLPTVKTGVNKLKRRSNQSSVTIPYLEKGFGGQTDPDNPSFAQNFCGCGWWAVDVVLFLSYICRFFRPDHMLIPRGTSAGFPCVLFVMITDYNKDSTFEMEAPDNAVCKDASAYCGLRDRKYPDK